MTAAFIRDGLAQVLERNNLLPTDIEPEWALVRRTRLTTNAGAARLFSALGYRQRSRSNPVTTREGPEDGGWLHQAPNGSALRAWQIARRFDVDTAARGDRFSPYRIAHRVLLAAGESVGLILYGDALHLVLSDPCRAGSTITFRAGCWRDDPVPPDPFRVLLALAGAQGLPFLPLVLAAARLHQTRVTTGLRRQARDAITGFINAVLDQTPQRATLAAATLWREGLVLVYRLLFILKLESPAKPGCGFSFATNRLWRTMLSPNYALGPLLRRHLDHGVDTGRMLEIGLRTLFTCCRDGLSCSALQIDPFGGGLFGPDTTPLLDTLDWGERAVAILLDRLLWITGDNGEQVRVHYGSLNVEDLGSVYEALLEQEPGLAAEPLVRQRRDKLEIVVPANGHAATIHAGQFFLRTGPGRKATGSFYTPHEFVGFLVRETLAPKIAFLSPPEEPNPAALLTLKIVDPATGSGHFLVEACRYLGEALLTACRICDERGLHDRIAALPDPDNTIAPYLPSRGFSEERARAICRRLVAVHCLYGCDRNALAIELAKLSLWLESHAEGLPLTFLDHRLVHGDALTGPFGASLATLPVTGGPLDPLLARDVADRLDTALRDVRRLAAVLDATIGSNLDEMADKQRAKDRLDARLLALRKLARAWSGAAMLHERDNDDVWLDLARHVAETGAWPASLTAAEAAIVVAGQHAVPWDLQFPEIFPTGFSVILGNPPWDVVLPNTSDFLSAVEPALLDAATSAERTATERAILLRPDVAAAFATYRASFDQLKHVANRLYRHQRVTLGTGSTAGNLDLYRLFAERSMQIAAADGTIGILLPSAFHANEGSTGVRNLYLQESHLVWCLSFENRRRLFEIHSRFKFDLVVARRPGPTDSIRCGFYLGTIADVDDPDKIMNYSREFLEQTGGAALTPLELRSSTDLRISEKMFSLPERFGAWCERHHIRFGRDLHMTDDAHYFQPNGTADLVVHEGKTIHQYTDAWDTKPRYSVSAARIRPAILEASRYYRLAFRDIARPNDERTMIACIAPPGVVFGHTATVEKAPWARANSDALVLCALFNSCTFDWLVRQKATTHLSLYILDSLPVPPFDEMTRRFLAHAATQLSCTHAGFEPLWREQFGDRFGRPPVLPDLRAQIDAVVADAYGLDRTTYIHLLASFRHRADPTAAGRCLTAFDGLQAAGPADFLSRHDAFRDHDLVTIRPAASDAATRCLTTGLIP